MAPRLVGAAVAGSRDQGTISMGMALLSKGENRQDLLPANESRRPRPHPKHHARGPASRRSRVPGRRDPSQPAFSTTLRTRWNQAQVGRGNGPGDPVVAQRSPQDMCYVLRRAPPESSIEILGHSVAGVTYRHYAHRAPLAFKAIMTIPQPSAFAALLKGHDGECPCCRTRFTDAM